VRHLGGQVMSTHDHGTLYGHWQKMEDGITALKKELAIEQMAKIDLAAYQPGQPHFERLWEQIEAARRWTWPLAGYQVNL
jgi:hypothetical protein